MCGPGGLHMFSMLGQIENIKQVEVLTSHRMSRL